MTRRPGPLEAHWHAFSSCANFELDFKRPVVCPSRAPDSEFRSGGSRTASRAPARCNLKVANFKLNPVETGVVLLVVRSSKLGAWHQLPVMSAGRSHRRPPRELADLRTWAEVESGATSVKQPRLFRTHKTRKLAQYKPRGHWQRCAGQRRTAGDRNSAPDEAPVGSVCRGHQSRVILQGARELSAEALHCRRERTNCCRQSDAQRADQCGSLVRPQASQLYRTY